jgi:hypothetical protein
VFDTTKFYKNYATATEPTVANLYPGDGMQCCQDTYSSLDLANCPAYKSGNGANDNIANRVPSELLNPDLSFAVCPNWEKTCGTQTYFHYSLVNDQSTTVTLQTANFNNNHKCTYVITTDNQKAPGFSINANVMAGYEVYYVELTDPTMLGAAAGYTFSYFPDPTNVVYYRSYDQSAFYGGQLTTYSLRLNSFEESTAKYVQVPLTQLNQLNQ